MVGDVDGDGDVEVDATVDSFLQRDLPLQERAPACTPCIVLSWFLFRSAVASKVASMSPSPSPSPTTTTTTSTRHGWHD